MPYELPRLSPMSQPPAGAGAVTFSAGVSSNSLNSVVFSNLVGGVSFGLNGSTITASAPAVAGGSFSAGASNLGNTSGATGTVASRLVLAGINGITLSQSTNGASATVTISGITQTNQTGNLSATGNTTSASSGTYAATGILFNASGIVSVGASNGSVIISGTQSNQAVSGSNGSFTFQTATFGNSNNVSFYTTNGSMVAAAAVGTQTMAMNTSTAGGGTGGTSGSVTGSGVAYVFHAGSNITLSQSVNGSTGSLTIYGASGGAGGNQTIAMNTSTAGGGTGGTSGSVTGPAIAYIFHAGSNVTLSQSINGSTGSMSIYAAGAAGDVSSAAMSRWPPPYQAGWATSAPIVGTSGGTGGSTQWTASGFIGSVHFPNDLYLSQIEGYLSMSTTVAGTGSATLGYLLGIYTLNAGTALSLVSSFRWNMEVSQSSTTARTHRWYWGTDSTSNSTNSQGNIQTDFAGLRRFVMYSNTGTLSASNYYIAHMFTYRSSSNNVFAVTGIPYFTGSQTTGASYFGSTSISHPFAWGGAFSTTTNASFVNGLVMPASIHTSNISHSASSLMRFPYVEFKKLT